MRYEKNAQKSFFSTNFSNDAGSRALLGVCFDSTERSGCIWLPSELSLRSLFRRWLRQCTRLQVLVWMAGTSLRPVWRRVKGACLGEVALAALSAAFITQGCWVNVVASEWFRVRETALTSFLDTEILPPG